MNISRFQSVLKGPVLVVITHWNDEETTAKCLDYLQKSDYDNYQTFVVDSGSTDGSGQRLEERFPWMRLVSLQKNAGHSVAANAGGMAASYESFQYVLYLDNDAFLEKGCLRLLVGALENDLQSALACPLIASGRKPDTIWYGGGRVSLFGNGRHVGIGKKLSAARREARHVEFATSCVLLVRASVIGYLGLFDEALSGYSEDLDLSLRAIRCGFSILFVPDARALHGESANVIKVAGKHFRDYYTMRNRLYVIMKHGTLFQRTVGILATISWYGVAYGVVYLAQGELKRVRALIGGVSDFLRNRMGWREL